jgi:hypothetical protein
VKRAALPTLAPFYVLADGKEIVRLERASHPSHGIREPRPRRRLDRLGVVQTRHLLHDDGALLELPQRRVDRLRSLAEVRAEPDEGFLAYIACIGGHARL